MEEVTKREGKCTNTGVCSKANSEEIQVFDDPFEELTCKECGSPLTQVEKEVSGRKSPAKALIIGGIAFLLLAGGYANYHFMTGKSNQPALEVSKKVSVPAKSNVPITPVSENSSTAQAKPVKEPVSPPAATNSSKSITANSLEEALTKIGDETINAELRLSFSNETINKYFVNKSVKVVEVGSKGTEIGNVYTIQDIIDKVLTGSCSVVIQKREQSNNKISKLFVQLYVRNT